MIVIVGLVILVAAVIIGVAGVLGNGDSAHALTHGFTVFGYHVTGSTGTLFLYGLVVGAVAMLGLSLLLVGARRSSVRGRRARSGLAQSRRETAAAGQERDQLLDQHPSAPAQSAPARNRGPGAAPVPEQDAPIASTPDNRVPSGERDPAPAAEHRGLHLFGRRSASH
jgi:hypothetical protein